jgi:hypothetical protein
MTSRRTKIATAAATVALSATGLALLGAAPAGAASASSATAPSARAAACDRTAWEAPVQGAPAGFGAGSPSGDYLWHDSHGFHLRVTHGKNHDQRVYSGVITASAAMRIDPVKLEKGDTLKLSANHRSLVFVFANHGYVDGVNFHTDCAGALAASKLHVGSSNLPAKQVYLGATRAHPAHVPFTVHRKPVPTT